jgi:peptide/nickel transport system substrate-binding protein
VEVEELELAAWIDKIATTGKYDVTTDVYDTVPSDPAGMFNSDNLAPAFNINRYNPPGYAKQVEAAATEADEQRRIALYRELQTRLLDDMPMVTVAHTPLLLGTSNDLNGFSVGPTGLYVYTEATVG